MTNTVILNESTRFLTATLYAACVRLFHLFFILLPFVAIILSFSFFQFLILILFLLHFLLCLSCAFVFAIDSASLVRSSAKKEEKIRNNMFNCVFEHSCRVFAENQNWMAIISRLFNIILLHY